MFEEEQEEHIVTFGFVHVSFAETFSWAGADIQDCSGHPSSTKYVLRAPFRHARTVSPRAPDSCIPDPQIFKIGLTRLNASPSPTSLGSALTYLPMPIFGPTFSRHHFQFEAPNALLIFGWDEPRCPQLDDAGSERAYVQAGVGAGKP
ncbi:hypothetical protein DXG01_009805, partial [Tephrocybe rancida]